MWTLSLTWSSPRNSGLFNNLHWSRSCKCVQVQYCPMSQVGLHLSRSTITSREPTRADPPSSSSVFAFLCCSIYIKHHRYYWSPTTFCCFKAMWRRSICTMTRQLLGHHLQHGVSSQWLHIYAPKWLFDCQSLPLRPKPSPPIHAKFGRFRRELDTINSFIYAITGSRIQSELESEKSANLQTNAIVSALRCWIFSLKVETDSLQPLRVFGYRSTCLGMAPSIGRIRSKFDLSRTPPVAKSAINRNWS